LIGSATAISRAASMPRERATQPRQRLASEWAACRASEGQLSSGFWSKDRISRQRVDFLAGA
jgi:hypothetical protein